ncbi:MAG: type II secretion system secretin GspD [Kiritimatiellae bacterium]|nr:type II secretion system secretin GspD [Kiritimatiellia bacterium]
MINRSKILNSPLRIMAMRIFCMLIICSSLLCLGATDKQETMDFSFDKVDIATFVRMVGDITGKRFVISDDIKGKITVVSPQVKREEVYSLFVSILESAGCSVVQEDDLYRVVALPRGNTVSTPIIASDEETPKNGIVTKIIHLDNIAAESVRKLLETKMGGNKSGSVAIIEETNHLIITDTATSIRRIEKIIAEIDRPGLARSTEIVILKFTSAVDLARQLNDALAESESRADKLKNRLPSTGRSQVGSRQAYVVASPDSNKLILIGPESQVKFMKDIISKMDVDVPAGTGRLNAIFLKYISSDEAAKSINALLDKSAGKGSATGKKRSIAIESNIGNNALLVDASPGDLRVVTDLINQLDIPREQVHIEVVIAEVTVDDNLNLGVELAALNMPSALGETVVQGASLFQAGGLLNSVQEGLFPNGISIAAAHGSHYDAGGNLVADYPGVINIEAIKTDSRMKILSETALEAQNNSEASVRIVDEIPILTSTIQGGTGASRDVIQNIERIEVGIKLVLTPHVIPGGLVRMELNPLIEAIIESKNTDPEMQLTPTIARREVKTTVTVPDGKTIIIAGLTRQDKAEVVRKVPLLGSIPVIGFFFRQKAVVNKTTDLLIFVTPRVVSDIAVAEELMNKWQDKTGLSSNEKEQQTDE